MNIDKIDKKLNQIYLIISPILCLMLLYCTINLRKEMLYVDCGINHMVRDFNINHYKIDLNSVNIINLYILLMVEYIIVACILTIISYIKGAIYYIIRYTTRVYFKMEKNNIFNLKEEVTRKLNALALTFIFIIPCVKPSILDSLGCWIAWSTLLYGIPMFFILVTYFLFKQIKINNIKITFILIFIFPIAHWFIHYYTKISRLIY